MRGADVRERHGTDTEHYLRVCIVGFFDIYQEALCIGGEDVYKLSDTIQDVGDPLDFFVWEERGDNEQLKHAYGLVVQDLVDNTSFLHGTPDEKTDPACQFLLVMANRAALAGRLTTDVKDKVRSIMVERESATAAGCLGNYVLTDTQKAEYSVMVRQLDGLPTLPDDVNQLARGPIVTVSYLPLPPSDRRSDRLIYAGVSNDEWAMASEYMYIVNKRMTDPPQWTPQQELENYLMKEATDRANYAGVHISHGERWRKQANMSLKDIPLFEKQMIEKSKRRCVLYRQQLSDIILADAPKVPYVRVEDAARAYHGTRGNPESAARVKAHLAVEAVKLKTKQKRGESSLDYIDRCLRLAKVTREDMGINFD